MSRTQIGRTWVALLALLALVAVAAPAVAEGSGSAWVESAKLIASDTAEGDGFGDTVAVSGNTLVASTGAESAYVFTRTGTGWAEVATLPAGGPVAISGNTIVAHADRLAHVFTRTPSAWAETGVLHVGGLVAISGDTIVVGTWGSANVFERTASGWVETAELTAPNANEDGFGESVAISGNTIVVGAPFANIGGTHTGAAYVFTRTPSGWVESAVLPGDGSWEYLGRSVAISGNTIVSPATGDIFGGHRLVYVFALEPTGWVQSEVLTAPDFIAGGGVGISGDTMVVGAPYADTEAAYVYRRTRSGWVESATFTVEDFEYDFVGFGFSLAISRNTIVGGAPLDDDVGAGAGAVYVFSRR